MPAVREVTRTIAMSPAFNRAIVAVLVVNAIALGCRTAESVSRSLDPLLIGIEVTVVAIFVGEMVIRVHAMGRHVPPDLGDPVHAPGGERTVHRPVRDRDDPDAARTGPVHVVDRVGYIVLTGFIVLNLLIAVIVNAVERQMLEARDAKEDRFDRTVLTELAALREQLNRLEDQLRARND